MRSCDGWGCGMAESPRLGWPYPDERARSWYPDFQALVNALDASVYASLSAPHFIFSGGGTLVWDDSTGGLTWSGAFTLSAPGTGFKWTIAAGSAVLADGDYGAVTIEPGITEAVSVNVSVLTRIEDLTTNAVLFRRIGSDLVFRTGHVIAGTRTVVATDLFGQALTQDELAAVRGAASPGAANPFATMADLGGPGGPGNPEYNLTGGGVKTGLDLGASEVVGTYYFDPAEHPDVTAISLRAEGWTSTGVLTGAVELYNPDTAAVVATVNLTSATPGEPVVDDAPLASVPAVPVLFWLRMSVDNTGLGGDVFRLLRAVLLMT